MYSHLYCIVNIYKRNKDVRKERFERKSWWVQVSANRVTRFLFIYDKMFYSRRRIFMVHIILNINNCRSTNILET